MTGVKISRYLVVYTLITIPNLTRLDEMQTVQYMKEDITLYEGFFSPIVWSLPYTLQISIILCIFAEKA